MIKVPATPEGIPAIRQLISEGINVNVTLLFAQAVYEQVAEAYIAGLEERAAHGEDISRVASVASFFVSRIDTVIDGQPAAKQHGLAGKVAIANAKLTYHKLQPDRQQPALGRARREGRADAAPAVGQHQHQEPQLPRCHLRRGTDRPDTVNTIPPATFNAFRDHGSRAPA